MMSNLHPIDRIIRVLIGVVAIYFALTGSFWFLAVAAIMLVTGGMSFCPLYKALGISTTDKAENSSE